MKDILHRTRGGVLLPMDVVDFSRDIFAPYSDDLVGVVQPGPWTVRGHFHIEGREWEVTVRLVDPPGK